METELQVVFLDVTWEEKQVVERLAMAAIEMHVKKFLRPDAVWKLFSVVGVTNYDNDSRALWEIEEARAFFKLLIDNCGWYGLVRYPESVGLVGAMQLPDEVTEQEARDFWAPIDIANGSEHHMGFSEVPQALERANKSCNVFVSKVKPEIYRIMAPGIMVVPLEDDPAEDDPADADDAAAVAAAEADDGNA